MSGTCCQMLSIWYQYRLQSFAVPLSSELGTCNTVRPDFGLGFPVKVLNLFLRCSLFARKRTIDWQPNREREREQQMKTHPGGNPGENLKSISHRCYPILVAFAWELTKEAIGLPLGCLQGGASR